MVFLHSLKKMLLIVCLLELVEQQKGTKDLTQEDIFSLRMMIFRIYHPVKTPFFERKSASYFIWGGTVNYKEELGNYRIQGVYPDHQFIENASIVSGRFLNQSDMFESKKKL